MTLETIKKLWKNEYFQTVITLVLLLGFVFGSWYIIQRALGTEYPALAVASGSMLPTLNVGDLIIVQGIDPGQINAAPLIGDIIVFKKSNNDLVVHRAIEKINGTNGYLFVTKGDNNPSPDPEKVEGTAIKGRVVARIPWVGNFALLLHSQQNVYLFTVIVLILIVIFLFFPFETGEKEKKSGETLIFGRISLKLIYLLILNIFLIGLIIFGLWGTFTFWNPGAGSNSRGMYVTVYGMFSDVTFHKTHAVEVFLYHGFLTYTINCQLSSGLQTGVPTFSWSQTAIIILLLLDAWNLVKFLIKQGKLKLGRQK